MILPYPLVREEYMDIKPPASLALDSMGIEHRIFFHERPVTSFEQAASDRNQRRRLGDGELKHLMVYLERLKKIENIRRFEKRDWRTEPE